MRQSESELHFQVLNGSVSHADKLALENYFQLGVNFAELCTQWSETDALFRSAVANLKGVRILRQDPLETLLAFICSSNNNIPRISQMMNRLCATYGQLLGTHAGQTFHSFPSLGSLAAEPVEAKLRELGFGYRAKYVVQAAQYILSLSGEQWLTSLCDCSYEDAWRQLQKVPGVGPKVHTWL